MLTSDKKSSLVGEVNGVLTFHLLTVSLESLQRIIVDKICHCLHI